MNVEATELTAWKGRTQTSTDWAAPAPIRGLAALLDRALDASPGSVAPPLAHWLYFLPDAPQSELGVDGHPRTGGFLPPVKLPRRMWAGSRVQFHSDLRIGAQMTRTSRIADVNVKQGRSGALVFVQVAHEVCCDGVLAISEEQDIVYREAVSSSSPPAAAPIQSNERQAATWSRTIRPDPVLLFRYSALTFNAHRIHYDRPYAMQEEHYPALVVHGPLIATLLLDLVLRSLPNARIAQFSFRAMAPLFDSAPFSVCGARDTDAVRLWAHDERGVVATEARAVLV